MRLRAQAGWGFGLLWVLATAVGWYAGMLAGGMVTLFSGFVLSPPDPAEFFTVTTVATVEAAPAPTAGELIAWAAGGAVAGLIISTLQWLVLRRQIRNAWWWVFVSTAGMTVTWVIASTASPQDYAILFGLLNGVFQSLVLGRWRWLFLLWIPVTTIAWIAGYGIYASFAPIVASGAVWNFTPGIVAGIITGIMLVWLLHRPIERSGHTSTETLSHGAG